MRNVLEHPLFAFLQFWFWGKLRYFPARLRTLAGNEKKEAKVFNMHIFLPLLCIHEKFLMSSCSAFQHMLEIWSGHNEFALSRSSRRALHCVLYFSKLFFLAQCLPLPAKQTVWECTVCAQRVNMSSSCPAQSLFPEFYFLMRAAACGSLCTAELPPPHKVVLSTLGTVLHDYNQHTVAW